MPQQKKAHSSKKNEGSGIPSCHQAEFLVTEQNAAEDSRQHKLAFNSNKA